MIFLEWGEGRLGRLPCAPLQLRKEPRRSFQYLGEGRGLADPPNVPATWQLALKKDRFDGVCFFARGRSSAGGFRGRARAPPFRAPAARKTPRTFPVASRSKKRSACAAPREGKASTDFSGPKVRRPGRAKGQQQPWRCSRAPPSYERCAASPPSGGLLPALAGAFWRTG